VCCHRPMVRGVDGAAVLCHQRSGGRGRGYRGGYSGVGTVRRGVNQGVGCCEQERTKLEAVSMVVSGVVQVLMGWSWVCWRELMCGLGGQS